VPIRNLAGQQLTPLPEVGKRFSLPAVIRLWQIHRLKTRAAFPAMEPDFFAFFSASEIKYGRRFKAGDIFN